MRFLKTILVLTLVVLLTWPVAMRADADTIARVSGTDRYATAVEVSKYGWNSSSTVVIARGDDYADALAGVPLAYRLGAPILLAEPTRLPSVTRQEIVRLGASQAVVLGGTKAVDSGVVAALEDLGLEVERISGENRFDTAARIASRVAPYGTNAVIVANGRNFPDALAAAPYAAVAGYPILLVEWDSVPAVTTNAIRGVEAKETIVVGGSSVIASSVVKKLPGAQRISGSDRYATAVALAKYFNPPGEDCFIATGRDFADAITGAVLAARRESGIFLVGASLPWAVQEHLTDNEIKQVCILGGAGAVSNSLVNAIRNILIATPGVGVTGWTSPGANVKIGSRNTVADSEGRYLLSGLASGEHTAVFSLEGYGTKSIAVKVTAKEYSVLNMPLELLTTRDIFLRGVVVEKATGKPMEDVKVIVEVRSSDGDWIEEAELTTNDKGLYTLANPSEGRNLLHFGERVRLTFKKDFGADFRGGWHPVQLTLDLKQDETENIVPGVQMAAVKELTIMGKVTNPQGEAVPWEDVILSQGDRKLSTETDAEGYYTFQDITLPGGKYIIDVDHGAEAGYAIYRQEVAVAEGKDLTHDIKLVQGYDVHVEVKPAKDTATFKGGADAALIRGGAEIPAGQVSENENTLSFTWSRIAPASYSVRIDGDYIITKTFSLRVYSSDLSSINQRVTRAGAIQGTVKVDGDEAPLMDAKVELLNTSGKTVAAHYTDNEGKYCFGGLADGSKYAVRVSKHDYRTQSSPQYLVQVNNAQIWDCLLPILPPTASVMGTVRTSGTLMPAEGAEIHFRAIKVEDYQKDELVLELTGKDAVNSTGEYATVLNPGAYVVIITDPGKHEVLEKTLTVGAGDVLENHNYTLQPGGNATLTVSVKDSLNRVVEDVVLTDKWGDPVPGSFKDGKTVFANLSAGTYTVAAQSALHEDLTETVTVAKGAKVTENYTLVASAKVHDVAFWVLGEDNLSLSDVRVIITKGTEQVTTGVTNSNGRMTVRLPNGTYKAQVYADRYIMNQVEFTIANRDITIPVIRMDKW